MPDEREFDLQVRSAAFEFLKELQRQHGEVVPRQRLLQGFEFQGRRIPLLGPEGIFKPKVLPRIPLSITTTPAVPNSPRPYPDAIGTDGLVRYSYRRDGPNHPDNVGLRQAMVEGVPLIYHYGIVPSQYVPVWPVRIVADDPIAQIFTVAVDLPEIVLHGATVSGELTSPELVEKRRYATRTVMQRLHQRTFRERVLSAYRDRCAICRLRHRELLDAAHILSDADPDGEPTIPNGLSLCKLHHAAFDQNIIGIRPDLVVELRTDILNEADGPMLTWGLQHFQGASVDVPHLERLRPNREFLERRYSQFRAA